MRATLARAGSNTTVAVFALKSMLTELTPETCDIAVFTVIGQVGQVMLAIANVAVA
jgi:hypothetical protein